jgi:type II secretion system protein I
MPRSGTTLIEALVAIALVATVLPVALNAVGEGSQAIERARRSDLANRVAQARLARLLADGSWSTSAASGTCDAATDGADADGLRWTLSVATWRDPVVRTLGLTVTWGEGKHGGSVTVSTLALPASGSGK